MTKIIVGGYGVSNSQARRYHRGLVDLTGSEDYEGLDYDELIEAARDPDSPFHDYKGWKWDIAEAAMAHWREAARRFVSSIRVQIVTIEGHTVKAREVINLKTSSDHQRRQYNGHLSRAAVKRRRLPRQTMVDRALEELWQWAQRYGDFEELTRHRRSILRLPNVRRS